MDDLRLEELRLILRDLARHLADQNDTLVAVRRAVGAIQLALDSDSSPQGERSALSQKYREHLAGAIASESLRQNPSGVALQRLLERMKSW
jgi:hypothetical protein